MLAAVVPTGTRRSALAAGRVVTLCGPDAVSGFDGEDAVRDDSGALLPVELVAEAVGVDGAAGTDPHAYADLVGVEEEVQVFAGACRALTPHMAILPRALSVTFCRSHITH